MTLFIWGLTEGLGDCFEGCSERQEDRAIGMMLGGMLGLLVFRTWETIDAFVAPSSHNRRLRQLHMRLGVQPMYARVSPYVSTPRGDGGGAVGGLTIRF